MSDSANLSRSSKKRGQYMQYLLDSVVKIPRVSNWRRRGRRDKEDVSLDTAMEEEENVEENNCIMYEDCTPLAPEDQASTSNISSDVLGDLLEQEYPGISEFKQLILDPLDAAIAESQKQYDSYADDDPNE